MKKLILLSGISGSGKSSWAHSQFLADPKNVVIVNRDKVRELLFGYTEQNIGDYYLKEDLWFNEKSVTHFCDTLIHEALANDKTVIVDQTNTSTKRLQYFFDAFNSVAIEIKMFDCSLEEAILRDSRRVRVVGKDVIERQFKDYKKLKEELAKGHHLKSKQRTEQVYTPKERLNPKRSVIEYADQDEALPPAIISDIDSTVAFRVDRGPFEEEKVGEDVPNAPIVDLIQSLWVEAGGLHIIFVSGRSDACYAETQQWLKEHFPLLVGVDTNAPLFELFMRKSGDSRSDDIIKKEIYDTHIKGKYYVKWVLDDRLRVCKLWHREGLPLLRVGDPESNF